MEYEGRICRGPMERASYMLPVAVGCSYNACKFCMLFKHLSYRELPREQIEAEMQRVAAAGGNPKTIFLGDGNALGLPTEQLLWILGRIHHYFPGCEKVNIIAHSKGGLDSRYMITHLGLADKVASLTTVATPPKRM